MEWLEQLKAHSVTRPTVVLRLHDDEWDELVASRGGASEFTIARRHASFDGVRRQSLCLIFGSSVETTKAMLGIINSRGAVATLQSRIKVRRAVEIQPSSEREFCNLLIDKRHHSTFKKRRGGIEGVTKLSPGLSGYIIEQIASLPANRSALRRIAETLTAPSNFNSNRALQYDAVRTALTAFGLTSEDSAYAVELVEGKQTALGQIRILEDAVIEHDARSVPHYDLIESDVTGRALFSRFGEKLEVFTANRRALEKCLGVDLIYMNLTKKNIVMLQYKMLERNEMKGGKLSWTCRVDAQFKEEVRRMKLLNFPVASDPTDYRLHSGAFYFKFVKREAALSKGGVIIPLTQFENLRKNSKLEGSRKGLRVDFDSLGGRYLRTEPFLDLLRCGYIGTHSNSTKHLRQLIQSILDGNKAVVTAFQTSKS